ncbi:MAG: DUF3048 domain-containing protein [Patescibacteria group bacterium]
MKNNFFKKYPIWILITLVAAIALGIYAFRSVIFFSVPQEVKNEQQLEYQHPLTGVMIENEIEKLPQVFAVVVDNHIDAQPLSGVDKAFLVIEAPVEGGITRLLSFFDINEKVDVIGPVRSARPYFIDWVAGLDAMFAHVGGSPEALDILARGQVFDLNEYWNGDHFWRENGTRFAPHNVYISTEELNRAYDQALAKDKVPQIDYSLWKFKQQEAVNEKTDSQEEFLVDANEVSVSFPGSGYEIVWKFDKGIKKFVRVQNGVIHKTRENEMILADNVLILEMEIEVTDKIGRRHIDTIGDGVGYLLSQGDNAGKAEKIKWEKKSAEERMKFYWPESNDEIYLNPGNTWIEIIGDSSWLETE